MTGPAPEEVRSYFERRQGQLLPFSRIAHDLGIPLTTQDLFRAEFETLGAHALEGDIYVFDHDRERLAFRMMQQVAPNISLDEFREYRDAEHILVRISRDRMVIAHDENRTRAGIPKFLR